jgi:uncharacterized protein YhaN
VTRAQTHVTAARADHAARERAVRAAPHARTLADAQDRLAAIRRAGAVLDPAAVAEWEAESQALREAEDVSAQLEAELATLREQRGRLVVDETLLADATEIGRRQRECQARLGDRDRAAQALDDAADAEQAAWDALAGLALPDSVTGPTGAADRRPVRDLFTALRVPDDRAAQLDALAAELTAARQQVREWDDALRREAERLAGRETDTDASDPQALAAVTEIVAALEANGSAAQLQRDAVLDAAKAHRERDEALLLAGLPQGAAVPTQVPSVQLVRDAGQRLTSAQLAVEQAEQAVATAGEAVNARRVELTGADAADAPGPGELTEARQARDRAVAELVTAWLTARPVAQAGDLPGRVERLTARADWVADEVARHAGTVARREQLTAALTVAEGELAAAHARLGEAGDQLAGAQQQWRDLWPELAAAGRAPDPAEALEVRRHLEEAQAAQADLTAAQTRLDGLHPQVTAQTGRLAAALERAGRPRPDADLDSLLAAARQLLAEADAARERRATTAQLQEQYDEAARQRDAAQQAAEQVAARWRDLLGGLGLPADLDSVGWARRCDLLRAADERLRAADTARAQAQREAAAYEEFAGAVRLLGHRHHVDAGDEAGAVDALAARLAQAEEVRRAATDLDRRVTALTADQTEVVAARQAALDRLQAVQVAAGVAAPGDLEAAAHRGQEAARLEDEIRQAAQLIQAIAPDVDRPDHPWVAALAGAEDAVLAADLATAQAALADAEQTLGDALSQRGEAQERLRALSARDGAAELHAKAQEHLAVLAERVERYLVTDIQRQLLADQLEEYERRHASPLLDDAGALLERLTDGRYVALRAVDRGDRRSLVILGADEQEHTPDQLSEGTADQVFLALRLAGIASLQAERRARGFPPLPVVLDDVLMAFDDERTAAALTVMAELSRQWQTVVFSHHAHVGELAGTLDPALVTVSRLDSPAEMVAVRPADEVRQRARAARALPADPTPPGPHLTRPVVATRPTQQATISGLSGIPDSAVTPPVQLTGPATGQPQAGDQRAIRAWAREHGLTVGERGRLPADVVDAYTRAHSTVAVGVGTGGRPVRDGAGDAG